MPVPPPTLPSATGPPLAASSAAKASASCTWNPLMSFKNPSQVSATTGSDHSSLRRSEEHTSELQSLRHLVCRLLLRPEDCASETERLPHGGCLQRPKQRIWQQREESCRRRLPRPLSLFRYSCVFFFF